MFNDYFGDEVRVTIGINPINKHGIITVKANRHEKSEPINESQYNEFSKAIDLANDGDKDKLKSLLKDDFKNYVDKI